GSDAGGAIRRQRPGEVDLGMLRRVWREPHAVLVFEIVLAVSAAADAGGIFHHAADGVVEHADSGDGSGRAPRAHDGGVLDDVHGNGSDRRTAGWCAVGPVGGAADRVHWRVCVGDGSVVVRRAAAEDSSGGEKVDRGTSDGRRRAGGRDVDAGGGGLARSMVASLRAQNVKLPSMRRPVGVKWVLLFFRWTKFFFPPSCQLSPPFHPHSSMSDLVSLGASWVFSFQPVLPPVCRPFFQLHDGSSGQAIDAVTGTRRLGFCVFPS